MSEILLVNPRRRRRRKKTTTRKRRRNPVANPRRRRRRKTTARRRRRNPARRVTMMTVQRDVMEALQGATGALALDITLGYLPIPANLKVGFVGTAVKALAAIGLGIVGQNMRVVRPATAKAWANGALTVVLHDELKKQLAIFAPNIPLGEYLGYENDNLGYYGSGYNPGPMYLPDLQDETMGFEQSGMSEYMDDFDLNQGNYNNYNM